LVLAMWLAIEGVVGAGKTTTSSMVGELSGMETALERLDEHPFLEAYYRDPSRYAVEAELVFMLIQIRQLQESLANDRLITDFAPAKNLIFARLETGGEDLRLLEMADARLWKDLPRPDMTVVLDVPLEVCRERLVARGRPYEQGLSIGGLARIRDGYLQALDSLGTAVTRIELTGTENPLEVASVVMQAADLKGPATTAAER
jgi:deoxyadenosine/deoxycytidine kinase